MSMIDAIVELVLGGIGAFFEGVGGNKKPTTIAACPQCGGALTPARTGKSLSLIHI